MNQLTAIATLKHLHQQQISSQEWVDRCIRRIAEREPVVGAWQHLDADHALRQAERLDEMRATGTVTGALHGVPIAIKDNFATADMPTGWGTPIYEGTNLSYDAAVVERLRAAGAVIMGKTVLTEYAMARPGKTTNPHNPDHTPGGSSSGSAAAVADGMVPLAIGSQTLGSVVRPAAYCGVLGFKPSFGAISRYGLLPISRELDHVGVFAHSIADIALLCSVLVAPDGRDPDCLGGLENWKLGGRDWQKHPPRLALIRTPVWDRADAEAQGRLLDSAAALAEAGAAIAEVELPTEFEPFLEHANVLISGGLAINLEQDYNDRWEQLSSKMRHLIERGRTASPLAYAKVRQTTVHYSTVLTSILSQADAILTPATTGAAPQGLDDTGSPIFCALWTLCGLPAISVPAGRATNGLPLAVQLVGQRARDIELLNVADWAMDVLGDRYPINSEIAHSASQ